MCGKLFFYEPLVRERLSRHYGMENRFVELGMHIFAVEAMPAADFCPPSAPPPREMVETVDEFGVRWRYDGMIFAP